MKTTFRIVIDAVYETESLPKDMVIQLYGNVANAILKEELLTDRDLECELVSHYVNITEGEVNDV